MAVKTANKGASKPAPRSPQQKPRNGGVNPHYGKNMTTPPNTGKPIVPVGTVKAHDGNVERRTSEAPVKLHTHAPAPEAAQTSQRQSKTLSKVVDARELQTLFDGLCNGTVSPTVAKLEMLNGTLVNKVAKALGYSGYSSLKKAEVVSLIMAKGKKPAAEKGSVRELREMATALKASGMITGPVSSLNVEVLKNVVATAKSGKVAEVTKAYPNEGTADYNRMLLKKGQATGYPADVTKACKSMFGEKSSVSALKADQLKALVASLKLS